MTSHTLTSLEHVAHWAAVTRRNQREYFACRTQAALVASKSAERQLDLALAALARSREAGEPAFDTAARAGEEAAR